MTGHWRSAGWSQARSARRAAARAPRRRTHAWGGAALAGNRHVPSGLRRGIFGGMVAGPVCAGAGSPSDVMRRGGSFLRAPQSLPGCPGISGARARPAWREPATWGLLAQAHWASCVALRAKGRSFVREPQSLGGWRGGAGRWSVGARWCWALGDGTAAMQAADGDNDNDGAGGAVGGSEDLSSQHSPRAPDCQDSSGCLEGQGGSEGAVDEAAIALLRADGLLKTLASSRFPSTPSWTSLPWWWGAFSTLDSHLRLA
ncbi:uncharacterized protein [Equus caballus]|uniref:uncharacterized protein n=1 Tax=Equus caballus TaxID=9796 RepID=UPI0038B3AA55